MKYWIAIGWLATLALVLIAAAIAGSVFAQGMLVFIGTVVVVFSIGLSIFVIIQRHT